MTVQMITAEILQTIRKLEVFTFSELLLELGSVKTEPLFYQCLEAILETPAIQKVYNTYRYIG